LDEKKALTAWVMEVEEAWPLTEREVSTMVLTGG
jgi:hypothetical protein